MAEKSIEWVKKEYARIKSKYGLPSFEEINGEFEIERLQDAETELFVRRLRRCVADKILNMLKFLEIMVNPQNAPLFIHTILSNLSSEAKSAIERLYEEACKIEMRSFAFDTVPNEKEEIAFVKEIIKKWKELKKDVAVLNAEIGKAWGAKTEKEERKSLAG